MIDNFYEIRPLKRWLDQEEGLIHYSDSAISSLSVTPSTFGHAIIFPRKIVYEATDLEPGELFLLFNEVKYAKDYLLRLDDSGRKKISEFYRRCIRDDKLNMELNNMPKERGTRVLKDLRSQIACFSDEINHGEGVGQTVKQFHVHVVPRYRMGKSGATLIHEYEHPFPITNLF